MNKPDKKMPKKPKTSAKSMKKRQKVGIKVAKAKAQLAASQAHSYKLLEEIAKLRSRQSPDGGRVSQFQAIEEKGTTERDLYDASSIAPQNHFTATGPDDRTAVKVAISKGEDNVAQEQDDASSLPRYGLYAYALLEHGVKFPSVLGIDQKNA
ncbi:MAG TPA: hypothetical protein VH593_32490, partial [Ktedonobacteraceae bacterium]